MTRVYLDHNATTPLRAEARSAMCAAMDVVGNPSSVHAEGRAAKALVEKAREQVAALVGCTRAQVIFTSGATEAAALAVAQKQRHGGRFLALPTEHDCLRDWSDNDIPSVVAAEGLDPIGAGEFMKNLADGASSHWEADRGEVALVAISAANSETGMRPLGMTVPSNTSFHAFRLGDIPIAVVSDIVQLAGKAPIVFDPARKPSYAILSAHKLGGPKGVGALINFTGEDPQAILRGGGQEMGRRSGTENTIGIAGFGAAAQAAARDVVEGRWDQIEEFRNILENALEAGAYKTIFVGKDQLRLPNTACFAAPGWKGETQVMQMDLAGFAVSAGSACSSGKVRASRVLQAMGYEDALASSAIRVSLGLETTKDEVLRFARAWLEKREQHARRAA